MGRQWRTLARSSQKTEAAKRPVRLAKTDTPAAKSRKISKIELYLVGAKHRRCLLNARPRAVPHLPGSRVTESKEFVPEVLSE